MGDIVWHFFLSTSRALSGNHKPICCRAFNRKDIIKKILDNISYVALIPK